MAEITCPECDERIAVKSGIRVLCPTCGAQVAIALNLHAEPAEPKSKPREAADAADKPAAGKIKPGSKPQKRRDDDDDDYEHDHPRGRRPQRGGESNAGQIIGIILTVVVVVAAGMGLVYLLVKPAARPGGPPVAAPNANPNLNPLPGLVPPIPADTRDAERALPAFAPPFEVDPLMEQADRPVYLADMQEFGVQMGPWRLGKGELGDGARTPIKVNGTLSPKGLSVHPSDRAATRAAYALGGRAVTLSGAAALNDFTSEAWSPVVFTIVGDGLELWRSAPVTRARGPASFRVNVTGVKVLELRAILLGAHIGAHAVWVDPVIEK